MQIAEVGDSIRSLAQEIGLQQAEAFGGWLQATGPNSTEWLGQKNLNLDTAIEAEWLDSHGRTAFSIPNTAYIDIGGGGLVLAPWVNAEASKTETAWKAEGLKVTVSGQSDVGCSTIKRHLEDKNLYRYEFIGHGCNGAIIFNQYTADEFKKIETAWRKKLAKKEMGAVPTPENIPISLAAGKHVPFRIRDMRIAACESDQGGWCENVSSAGQAVTIEGLVTVAKAQWVFRPGGKRFATPPPGVTGVLKLGAIINDWIGPP